MTTMASRDDELPWYAKLLGGPVDTPGLARLIREYALVEDRFGMGRTYENPDRGFSVSCEPSEVRSILHLSDEVEGFRSFDGPLPLGLQFQTTRQDILRDLGPADHEIPFLDVSYGSRVMRYRLKECWIAIVISAISTQVRCLLLESPSCAARFVS